MTQTRGSAVSTWGRHDPAARSEDQIKAIPNKELGDER